MQQSKYPDMEKAKWGMRIAAYLKKRCPFCEEYKETCLATHSEIEKCILTKRWKKDIQIETRDLIKEFWKGGEKK